MTNTDFNFSDEDISNAINHGIQQRNVEVQQNIDVDPEKAAQAYAISKATGIPPSIVQDNFDQTKTDVKSALANQIIDNNPSVASFVAQNNLASAISNDDYANLDKWSGSMSTYQKITKGLDTVHQFLHPWSDVKQDQTQDPLRHFKEGGPLGNWLLGNMSDEDLKNHRFAASVAAGLATPAELFFRGVSGTIDTGLDQIHDVAEKIGGKSFADEMTAMAETEAFGMSGRGHMPGLAEGLAEQIAQRKQVLSKASTYLKDGEHPPPGLHPVLDQMNSTRNELALQQLEQAVKDAQDVQTRARVPELTENFARQPEHFGDGTINIKGDAVNQLYGEKIPAPGDGLLGDMDDSLANQLAIARETGADVTIPTAKFINRVTPELMTQLRDSIRAVDGGVTKTEMDVLKTEPPKPVIEDTASIVRQATGLEPLFSIGDRKLTLNKLGGVDMYGGHTFSMLDDGGNEVGSMLVQETKGGKELYVENIQGNGDYYNPNNFGPRLTRDVFRQLSAQFPNAEWITGDRVSGARERAGKTLTMPLARIRIRTPEGRPLLEDAIPQGWGEIEPAPRFSELLGGAWAKLSPGLEAYIKPSEQMLPHEQEMAQRVQAEIQRLAPSVTARPVSELRRVGLEDKRAPGGLYYRAQDDFHGLLLWTLNHEDQMGVARHEVIHSLRDQGFFGDDEWAALEKAAKDENWLDRFRINQRYARLDERGKTEEAICEAFRQWMKEGDQRAGREPSLVDRAFERFKELLDRIRSHLRDVLGKDPTFEDVFQRVQRGEVGRREFAPGEAPRIEPRFAEAEEPEGPRGTEVVSPFRGPSAIGMTRVDYENYLRQVREIHDRGLAAIADRALREQTKRVSDQWQKNSEAMRPEALQTIRQRPDVAADRMLVDGMIGDHKLENRFKLDKTGLTKEQIASLPEEYFGKRGVNQIPADTLAGHFNFQTGDQLIQALADLHANRQAGGGRERYMRNLVNNEINRKMEQKYGSLEDNILSETKDQVESERQMNLLHQETLHLGELVGTDMGNITREHVNLVTKAKFNLATMGSIASKKYEREAGLHGKAAESALLANKPRDAFVAKQAQYYNIAYARMARAVEKERAFIDRSMRVYSRTELPRNIPGEYLNHIQDLGQKLGYNIKRSAENIAENIERRGETLEQFINSKFNESFGSRDIPLSDAITDGKVGPIDGMTTYDFMSTAQTLRALQKNARDEGKIILAGRTADKEAVVGEMVDHVQRFPLRPPSKTETKWDKLKEMPRQFLAASQPMETFLNRMGNRDPESVFNRYLTYRFAGAANREAALERKYGKIYGDVGPVEEKNKRLQAPFNNPTGSPMDNFTRNNAAEILQNAGNKSNLRVMAQGYGTTPEALMQWLTTNMYKEDFDRAAKLGKNVFSEIIKEADMEYERIHGVTIDKIPLEPFTVALKDRAGNDHTVTYDGWYHRLTPDENYVGKAPVRGGAYQDGDFGHINTNNGYTRKRTGAIYPLSLNHDMTPIHIKQMIHDIAFRETILETQKIFRDSRLSNAITDHYGPEYNAKNFLLPYLKDIAGNASVDSKGIAMANSMAEYFRQNIISTYIAFNPFTALKHGPTALLMSMRQVGTADFLNAFKDLYTRSPSLNRLNHEFAMLHSEELQRRERNWEESIFGAHKTIEGASTMREHVMQWGSYLVAKSDMMSAKPTWLARYRQAIDEGLTHGDSVDRADAAVRLAHGTTAITNLPGLVRNSGPLGSYLTSVYGFFGTNLQRRLEIAHDINDAWHLLKGRQINEAAGLFPKILTDTMIYVVAPTLIEEWVTGLTTDDHRGWLRYALESSAQGLSSPVLGLRDIVHGLLGSQDIGVGLLSSALHDLHKAGHDIATGNLFTKQKMGQSVGDLLTVLGHAKGIAPKTIDNAIHFGIDLVNGQVHPHTAGDWARGIFKGKTQPRKVK